MEAKAAGLVERHRSFLVWRPPPNTCSSKPSDNTCLNHGVSLTPALLGRKCTPEFLRRRRCGLPQKCPGLCIRPSQPARVPGQGVVIKMGLDEFWTICSHRVGVPGYVSEGVVCRRDGYPPILGLDATALCRCTYGVAWHVI